MSIRRSSSNPSSSFPRSICIRIKGSSFSETSEVSEESFSSSVSTFNMFTSKKWPSNWKTLLSALVASVGFVVSASSSGIIYSTITGIQIGESVLSCNRNHVCVTMCDYD